MADYDFNRVPNRVQNIIGNKYERWLVVGYSHAKRKRAPGKGYHHYWVCQCECGTVRVLRSDRPHKSNSCGCYQREIASEIGNANKTHGMSDSPEWLAWKNMRDRCDNVSRDGYHLYGGRGIEVCDRWRDSFEAFYEDMGPRPSPNHSLDRIDPDGDYCKENCRWATKKQQSNNTRVNRLLTHDGKTMTLTQWARHLGMNPGTLSNRLNTLN